MPKINSQWKAAQAALVEAATHLNVVWENIESDNDREDSAIAYPPYLPDFPQFTSDLVTWCDATGTLAEQTPGLTERPKGKRSPVDVIAAIRRGDSTPVMGRAPIVVIAEIKDALKVALRAVELASVDLGLALPHRPNAGKPQAWINYAVATIERDERNADDEAPVVFPLPLPTAGSTAPTIKDVREEALLAFLAVVASRYPTATGGDLDPLHCFHQDQEAEAVIEQRVRNNVPGADNEDDQV